MNRFLSLNPFEHVVDLVVITDLDGCLLYHNHAAASWLRRPSGRRNRCWETTRFLTPDGEQFCRRECPVRRQARTGSLSPRHRVAWRSDTGHLEPIELFTFLMLPPRDSEHWILHVLNPLPALQHPGRDEPLVTARRLSPNDLLTPTELEILRLLATGLTSSAISTRLGRSGNTVRNHVQNILRKLCVHRQLDAILLFLQTNH